MLAVSAAIAIGVLYPNTADEPVEEQAPPTEAGQVYREPATVELSREERAQVMRTALEFVNTAVARRRAGDSYDIVSSELKQGMTREEWAQGEIPVQPYPATDVRATIDYSYANELGLRLLLVPPAASEFTPAVFTMDMEATGKGANRRWLVSAWAPTMAPLPQDAGSGPQGGSGGRSSSGVPNLSRDEGEGLGAPLGAEWLLIPAGIFSLILVVPLGLWVRSWFQNRRALREYEASRSMQS